jgi:hypothetical protein
MSQRLRGSATFEAAVGTILSDIVALHGAKFGNVQLSVGDTLIIVAQHGLRVPFLLAFREVRASDGCACGRAWQTGEPIIDDVEVDESLLRSEELPRKLDTAQFKVPCTVFANRYVPTKIEMATCKEYCISAADHLQVLLGGAKLESKARQLHDALYANLGVEDEKVTRFSITGRPGRAN